jgi:hypothetical protein
MSKPLHPHIRATALIALGLSVTACSKANDPAPTPTSTPTPTATVSVQQEDQFGMAFATGFRANNNSEPYSPQDGDIVATSPTAEPVTIN